LVCLLYKKSQKRLTLFLLLLHILLPKGFLEEGELLDTLGLLLAVHVTILVTRTLLFSLISLPCTFLVRSLLFLLTCRCASPPVTPSASITPCIPPLSRLLDAPAVFPSRILPFFHTLFLPSPFGEFCTPLLLSACSALAPCS
jgi:hypothetical protein